MRRKKIGLEKGKKDQIRDTEWGQVVRIIEVF